LNIIEVWTVICAKASRRWLWRKSPGEDERLKELELQLGRATKPVEITPALAQLRSDAELSKKQLMNKRLTMAQDLAWALINTPAFLFNR
jgi:hypothetical protein